MKIFFIGSVKFSERALNCLIDIDAEIVGVATKSKSSFNADHSDLSKICNRFDIPCKYVKDINAPHIIDWIRGFTPDVIFCFGWSNLIGKQLLGMTKLGVIGYHPTELPKNRGRHPIIWSLVLGLPKTASTFFFMGEGADDGEILSQEPIVIDSADDAQSLYDKLGEIAIKQIRKFHGELKNGTYMKIPQDSLRSNYWRKRTKLDGKIDFRMSSSAIHNLVRGLTKPYVGAHIEWQGKAIKVWKTQKGNNLSQNLEPGKVLGLKNHEIEVKTADSSIWITLHEFEELPGINEYL